MLNITSAHQAGQLQFPLFFHEGPAPAPTGGRSKNIPTLRNIMKLHTVTITGADEGTAIGDILSISGEYPLVEWGILLSQRQVTRPRYPTLPWVNGHLQRLKQHGVRFSAHICGQWAKQICRGHFPGEVPLDLFQRIQLNISAKVIRSVNDGRVMAGCLPRGLECIVTVDTMVREEGLRLVRQLRNSGHPASVLFDSSGGRGVAPATWPEPDRELPCGFAGGLKPETLPDALEKLASHTATAAAIWIDVETGVRSNDQMDLTKVRRFLEIASCWHAPSR